MGIKTLRLIFIAKRFAKAQLKTTKGKKATKAKNKNKGDDYKL